MFDLLDYYLEKAKTKQFSDNSTLKPINVPEDGEAFVEDCRKFGVTESESRTLDMSPGWFPRYLSIIGNLKINHTFTSGCSQSGKTLGHLLLATWFQTRIKLPFGWFYDSRENRDSNMPDQFRPVCEGWVKRMEKMLGLSVARKNDRKITGRYQVDGVTGIFSYASTSKKIKSRDGMAAAGGAAVSWTAHILFYEEKSQWAAGIDPSSRLEASQIPSKPIRELGTPGSGGGIERQMKSLDVNFYPYLEKCRNCGKGTFLDPKGCLLKPLTKIDASGKETIGYLSESGRPVEWWCRDANNPIETAYIACPHCGSEIPTQDRIDATFRDRRPDNQPGIRSEEFLEKLPDKQLRVGIWISPLLRNTSYNLAVSLISDGFNMDNPEDWQQQKLGHPSENQIGVITDEIIIPAIGAPIPSGKPNLVVAGFDQGRSEDWGWVMKVWFPPGWESLGIEQIFESSIREVVFAGAIHRDAIPELLQTHAVDYALIDSEPNISDAAKLASRTVLELADQKPTLKSAISDPRKPPTIRDGGRQFPCHQIRHGKFQDRILYGFTDIGFDGLPPYRLPLTWNRWILNKSELSPIRHLQSPKRDTVTCKWTRTDHIDDIFFAAMFAEAALYIRLIKRPPPVLPGMVGDNRAWVSALENY